MNKKVIIASVSAVVVAAGGFFGYKKLSGKKDSGISKASLSYETEGKAHYDLLNYSFDISNDFLLEEPDNISELTEKTAVFSSELVYRIDIEGNKDSEFDAEYEAHENYWALRQRKEVTDAAYEVLSDKGRRIGVCHYREKQPERICCECASSYTMVTEGKAFTLTAWYKNENKEKVLPMLEDIVKTAVYTSDYKEPTETYTIDAEYCSLTCDPKWGAYVNDTESEDGTGTLERVSVSMKKVSSEAEHLAGVSLTVEKPAKASSPAELADKAYEKLAANTNKSLEITNLKRRQDKIFGYDAEVLSSTKNLAGIAIDSTEYRFSKDGLLYTVTVKKKAGDSSMDSEIEKIISSIKIK